MWNFVAAGVLVIVAIIVLVVWLSTYTQHGIEVTVPDIKGMSVTEASDRLDIDQLELVVVDSTYSRKVPLGTIVEQTPVAGSHAKHGRAIYVTVNAMSRKMVPLPDLRDVSARQAQSTLEGMQFRVEDIVYRPSAYRDLVLDVWLPETEETLEPGTRLEEGSKVILVVGMGQGSAEVEVPELKGMSLADARQRLLTCGLVIGSYEYDEEPTEETAELYMIYWQHIGAGERLREGSPVNVKLSVDLSKAVSSDSGEEGFF